jgi:pyrimidine operon attenuation protein/uracil phosphoribosyltransferase
MITKENKIKDSKDILCSIKRIAFQVYEINIEEENLVIVGIGKRGGLLSEMLGEVLDSISDLKLKYVNLTIDKTKPYDNIQSNISLDDLENQSIVIVDDVLNTGSTLIHAVSYFLQIPVKRIKTAVMVNRNHKKFPIKADFKGISLSTSVNEHITVRLKGNSSGIYLS